MTKERKTYEIQKHRFIVHTHAYMFSKPPLSHYKQKILFKTTIICS